jgi:endonuclease/exonuclease/phosphatase family metal-dependent hydrolase
MKTKNIFNFFLIAVLFYNISNSQNISVMTYNLRLDVAVDGDNAWPNRKENLVSLIRYFSPDIFGTQEGLPHQIKYINDQLKNFEVIGQGREGGNKGEYSALFYNKNKFKILKENTFWLSQTPDKVSKGWDAAYLRICTYALFLDKKSNSKFWVYNTHLDNKGVKARQGGVKMILEKIKAENSQNYPVIFMGDLNSNPQDKVISIISNQMVDSKTVSIEKPFGPEGTFNNFKFDKPVTLRIDYIFIPKDNSVKVKKYAILSNSKDLKYPSDHLPVLVHLQIKNIK